MVLMPIGKIRNQNYPVRQVGLKLEQIVCFFMKRN